MGAPENIRRFEGECDNLWLGEVMDGSMEPTYPRGSVVPFRYRELAKDGDCCLVGFKGGDVAFRKVESGVGAYRLSALSGNCPAEVHPVGDIEFILPAGGLPPIPDPVQQQEPRLERFEQSANGWSSLQDLTRTVNARTPNGHMHDRTVSRVLSGLGFERCRTKRGVQFLLAGGTLA